MESGRDGWKRLSEGGEIFVRIFGNSYFGVWKLKIRWGEKR